MNHYWYFLLKRLGLILVPILILKSVTFAESSKETIRQIYKHKNYIVKAASKFDINPVILASVIYTERHLNFDWTDQVFDKALAMVGKNSSLGFCQVKLKTAYFIERQLLDSTSSFYLGSKYENILVLHQNPYNLINDLQIDSINILYAAAYLKIIQNYWQNAGYSIDDKPEIIGSLYQLGLFHKNGAPREPHFNPKANDFGKETLDSIYLFTSFGKFNLKFLLK